MAFLYGFEEDVSYGIENDLNLMPACDRAVTGDNNRGIELLNFIE